MDSFDPDAFVKEMCPEARMPSPTEVRTQAEERSESIYASYHLLREILVRHESTIQKRWIKKTRQQRQKILLDHWPGMPTTHRPDFEAFRRTNRAGGKNVSGKAFKDHYMWPQINQEDLLKPRAMLLLLNARGRNPPPAFSSIDFEAMYLGLASKNLTADFLNCHVMILHGAQDARGYGRLISWDNHPDAFEWLHTRQQYFPGEGLLVLEAQERLLGFLVSCCKQILSDIPYEHLLAPNFTAQPEPQLKTEKESTGFDSLVVMATEAPYRPPSQLDLARIELVLGGRLAAAEDHLWALREDPGYFAEQIIEIKEHRLELLKDTRGGDHPVLRTTHEDLFWARICSTLAIEAHLPLEAFADLHRQAQALQRLYRKHANKISPAEHLPEEFLNALLKFRYCLYQVARGPLISLQHSVAVSTPWRSYFNRQPISNPASTSITFKLKTGIKMRNIEKDLYYILRLLWEDGQDLSFFRLTLVVDELGRLLEAEPSAKDFLSARIASIVGDLAIISQCIKQIEIYFPWARTFESALVDREEGIKKEFAERTNQLGIVLSALHETNLRQIARLGNPNNMKFTYPIEKRRTKQNVEALRRAEENLDGFWVAVDRLVYAKCGNLLGSAQQRVLTQPRIMRRTPGWMEPSPSATKSGKEVVLGPDLEELYKPLSTIYIGESIETDGSIAAPTAKQKTKTKSTTTNTDAQPPTIIPSDDATTISISIAVDGRALKVFRTLFFNPAVTSSPGEVSWADFLHAMTSTGLFAAEKLYGCVWQFQRLQGGDQSRIQFHEPHPRGKIPFATARRYGRRLTRAFGWAGGTFSLKAK
ncbi:hypothetical protein SAMD00023353_4400550 [Rosellinia necatrix]|uniref:Uncharacterized protein n=1 Tax=Rosellinia necatrix TaxID=77044 RepID=A0A1W2TNJ6_ROSNE|nr:hypothetical protein SAMD00023353_4400550 [Rosellinia necatrix]